MAVCNKVLVAALCVLAVVTLSQALPQGFVRGMPQQAYSTAQQLPAQGYQMARDATRFGAQGSGPGGVNGAANYRG